MSFFQKIKLFLLIIKVVHSLDLIPCFLNRLLLPSYRPQRSCCQGYVFTRVCDSVHKGGLWQGEPPWQGDPLAGRTPLPRRPPGKETPWQEDPPGREIPWQEDPQQGDSLAGRPPGKETPSRETPWQGDPLARRPPAWRPPPWQGDPPAGRPPGKETPRQGDPPAIWSMSSRYTSYWNAFLFRIISKIECLFASYFL